MDSSAVVGFSSQANEHWQEVLDPATSMWIRYSAKRYSFESDMLDRLAVQESVTLPPAEAGMAMVLGLS
jgi:hypothetical protein